MHDGGQILAGVRLTPTTTTCGIYSYMIRDAQRGLLDSIPADLLEMEAPVDDHIWECTRAFVASKTPLQQRIKIYLELIGGMAKTSRELGRDTGDRPDPGQLGPVDEACGAKGQGHRPQGLYR